MAGKDTKVQGLSAGCVHALDWQFYNAMLRKDFQRKL